MIMAGNTSLHMHTSPTAVAYARENTLILQFLEKCRRSKVLIFLLLIAVSSPPFLSERPSVSRQAQVSGRQSIWLKEPPYGSAALLCCDLKPDARGFEVYEVVTENWGIPMNLQILTHRGKLVNPPLSLVQQGFVHGSTVFVEQKVEEETTYLVKVEIALQTTHKFV